MERKDFSINIKNKDPCKYLVASNFFVPAFKIVIDSW